MDGLAPLEGSVAHLIESVSKEFEIPVRQLIGRQQHKALRGPRLACYWLALQTGRWSSTQIGRIMGRDHTTILDGAKSAENMMNRDPEYRAKVAKLKWLYL